MDQLVRIEVNAWWIFVKHDYKQHFTRALSLIEQPRDSTYVKFLYIKLRRTGTQFFVGCKALNPWFEWLFICQNTDSTNAKCALNCWLHICIWFGEFVYATLVVTSLDDLHVTGRRTNILKNHGWMYATLYRETLLHIYVPAPSNKASLFITSSFSAQKWWDCLK